MKRFKEVLAEMNEAKSFSGSEDATDFIFTLADNINDPRLMDWAKQTDKSSGYKSAAALKKAVQAYGKFIDEMMRED